jgi:hypothetical protein
MLSELARGGANPAILLDFLPSSTLLNHKECRDHKGTGNSGAGLLLCVLWVL